MLDNKKNNKKGFSIGEVLLSVFILSAGLLTIMQLFVTSLKNFQDERDSVVASMLAQEGVELAINIRDNNWAQRLDILDTTPDTFDGFTATDKENCRVDINSSSIGESECNNGANHKKIYIDSNGYYTHNTTTNPTRFKRKIMIKYNSPEELLLSSLVSWNGSDPDSDIDKCDVTNKCVFSTIVMTNWGTGK